MPFNKATMTLYNLRNMLKQFCQGIGAEETIPGAMAFTNGFQISPGSPRNTLTDVFSIDFQASIPFSNQREKLKEPCNPCPIALSSSLFELSQEETAKALLSVL